MTAFEEYTDQYGCHFSKRLYEFALSLMTDRNGNKVQSQTKEQVTQWLQSNGITISNSKGWDVPYVYAMGKADYYGSSIPDDAHLAKFIKDFLDDPDGYPEKAFDHFVIDCRGKKEPIFWTDMI